ncbi:hypothetical protein OPV22_020307 [Ensete ventricosum]|uniref:Uncharacterized protein n=1 Tax=Ensete ventricosum TaxID=4639 RepID=A0AAV8QG43_ENSVE|nr:hypothetical protein OPV22_020307 [Ensete ventricosum]
MWLVKDSEFFDRPLSSSLGVPSANHGLGSEQQEMKKVAGRKPAVLHQPHVLASDDAVGLDGGDLIEDEIVLPPKPTENLDGGDVLATRPSPPRSCVAPARACRADPWAGGGGDVATLSSSL